MGIYQITCIASGKIYIGSSVDMGYRWYSHKKDLTNGHHSNSHLLNAWNLYGPDAFIFEEIQPVINFDNLHSIEEDWIRIKNSANRDIGYNIATSCTKSPSYGRPVSEETKQKLRDFNIGRKWTDEQKANLAKIKSSQDLKLIGQKAAETRKLKGIKPTPESRIKAKETRLRNGNTQYPKSWKPVIGIDDLGNEVVQFESTTAAYKAGYKGVVNAIKKGYRNGGLRWKYGVNILKQAA